MDYDVIIIGAGAAGLMTAIEAGQGGLKVLLLEGQKKAGAKILMSGGTRCNVTNKAVSETDFNSEDILPVRNILRSFNNENTIGFFKNLGVELVLEPTGKYFPSTHSGKTVLEALLRKVDALSIAFLSGHKVMSISRDKDGFVIGGDQFRFHGKKVVLACGGLSHPATGSDGTGYRLAQSLGHSMAETTPALTPLRAQDNDLKSLSGISLEVKLTLISDGKRLFSCKGGFVFTHFGFSGPAALDISRHYIRAPRPKQITTNFIPDYDENTLQTYLAAARKASARKTIKNVLMELMPQRLAEVILKKSGVEASVVINQLDKSSLQRLITGCVHYPLDVTGVLGYSKAEVTAGGVDWADIDPKTLESKLAPGLFFTGEILDADGRIGGFNFQWAWASGHAVAQALIKQERKGV